LIFKFKYARKGLLHLIKHKTYIFELVLLLSITVARSGLPQQKIMTNVEFLASVSEELAYRGIKHLRLNKGTEVFLLERGEKNAITHFVVNQFCHGLMKQEIKIFTVSADTGVTKGIFLSLIVSGAAVRYTRIYRKGFWGKPLLEREAKVDLSVRAVDKKNGEILWVGDLTARKRNMIPLSELEFVEQKGFLLGRPSRPIEKGIRRWAEPIFVSGVIAGVVYLFYSVRSR